MPLVVCELAKQKSGCLLHLVGLLSELDAENQVTVTETVHLFAR